MRAWLLVGLMGCGAADEPAPLGGTAAGDPGAGSTSTGSTSGSGTAGGTTSTYGWACRTDVPANELHGNYPQAELAAPVFAALNYDDTPRGPGDLMGHLTAMWFYPAAGTGG